MHLGNKLFGAKESPKTIHEGAKEGDLRKGDAPLTDHPDLAFS